MSLSRKIKIYQRRYLKFDITSGIVVFLVAIPLCLGIALASGAPLFSGIIAGIIGGIVVGSISESSVSVSGPAAGMVTVVLTAISQLGNFNIFLLALAFAGALQIIFGLIRAGFLANYIPTNVIQGLLCAIGILIIIKQIPLAFTHPVKNVVLMNSLKTAAQNLNLESTLLLLRHINIGTTIITLLSLTILIGFNKIKIEKIKAIPASVIVVILGIIINQLYIYFWPNLVQNSAQLVNIPVNGNVKSFFSQFSIPDFTAWLNPNVYWFGLSIAILASLETLLNFEAAEKLDKRRRYCSRSRELVAQGIGNLMSGFVGGLPITSVVVRTSVNIQAGCKTKFSTIVHGIFILTVVALAPQWLNKIPLASLAAILMYVGYKLTNISIYREMYAQGFEQFFPFLVTVSAIVFTNLLMGILIGLFISLFFILKSNSQVRFDIIREVHPTGIINRLMLPQQVSFLNKAGLIAELESTPKESQLIIDATFTDYIDKDILELIKEFEDKQAPDKKIALNLTGFKEKYDIHDRTDFISVTTYDVQSSLTPQGVLEILKQGNQRFIKDQRIYRCLPSDVKATAKNQHPIAAILGCIDSRVTVETIFDMGFGDIFTIRVAGNIINDDIIGSIEFACHAGAKLIVVLGHTQCGAIRAACDGVNEGYLSQLLEKIAPSIAAATTVKTLSHSENEEFLLEVTKRNISNSMQTLYQKSEIIRNLLNSHEIGLVAALYDVKSGQVTFGLDAPNLPQHFTKNLIPDELV
jgi:carbonic anhydrase